jgi:hypothetical protein
MYRKTTIDPTDNIKKDQDSKKKSLNEIKNNDNGIEKYNEIKWLTGC